jgi:adenosine deaminase
MTEVSAFIAGLPKAELHLHIEGTLEPELKFLLAERNGVDLPYGSAAEMKAAYDFDDLPSFLAVYYEGMSVLLKEQDFYDLTRAYLEKARSQNVLYAEIFFDPQAHTSRNVEFGTVIDGIHRAQRDGAEQLGIDTRLIMCFLRDMSAESASSTLEQAEPYRDRILGVGLDSDEAGNPPAKFGAVFAEARKRGYRLTMHCDVDQAESVRNIWQCVRDIGVERIDHGVNSLEDESLVAAILERGLALTVCPISNGYVTDGTKSAAIKEMLERGMRVTINSDDPAYFPGYMNENFAVAQAEGGLSDSDLVQISRNAFSASWLDDSKQASYLARLDGYGGIGD